MKRMKTILKWTAVVLGVLAAVGLVANAYLVWTTGTRLEQQLAAIRAAGDPLTLADLARPPIPPEKNADAYLKKAEEHVNAIDKIIYATDWTKRWDFRGPLPADAKKIIKEALAAHPEAMPLLLQASICQDYDAGLDYQVGHGEFVAQLFPVVQRARAASRVLQLQTFLLAGEGNHDEAVQTGLAIFRLARLLDRNPVLISYLAGVTLRGIAVNCINFALQSGPVSKEIRDALDEELVLNACQDNYIRTLKSELALSISFFNMFPSRNFWLVSRPFWNREESRYIDVIQEYLTRAASHNPRRLDQDMVEKAHSRRGVFASLLAPAIRALHVASTRNLAEIRCLRVLNALQTHVPAGSDAVPKLDELGLPVEATIDPFTGEPLHVKRLPRGWLVYSVGRNFKDDGGKVDDQSDGDVGVGPPAAE